jgi:hypothetical protein
MKKRGMTFMFILRENEIKALKNHGFILKKGDVLSQKYLFINRFGFLSIVIHDSEQGINISTTYQFTHFEMNTNENKEKVKNAIDSLKNELMKRNEIRLELLTGSFEIKFIQTKYEVLSNKLTKKTYIKKHLLALFLYISSWISTIKYESFMFGTTDWINDNYQWFYHTWQSYIFFLIMIPMMILLPTTLFFTYNFFVKFDKYVKNKFYFLFAKKDIIKK